MAFLNRRRFLTTTAAGIAATQMPVSAIQPIERGTSPVRKLSLAAYSLRDYFSGEAADEKHPKIDLADFVDYCASLGLEGAELTGYYFPEDVTREDILKLKRHAHLRGIDVSGGAIRNNFTGDPIDGELAHVQKWVEHYADLGAPVIRVFAGKPKQGVEEQVAIDRAIAGFKKACESASERGVILAVENHDFTTKVDRLMQIVEAVDSPWFGINLDTGNLNFSEDPYADMERMAPYAVNAQVKVKIKKAGGVVDCDLERVVKILENAKFSGYVVLEYEEEDPYEHIPTYVEQLRKLVG